MTELIEIRGTGRLNRKTIIGIIIMVFRKARKRCGATNVSISISVTNRTKILGARDIKSVVSKLLSSKWRCSVRGKLLAGCSRWWAGDRGVQTRSIAREISIRISGIWTSVERTTVRAIRWIRGAGSNRAVATVILIRYAGVRVW